MGKVRYGSAGRGIPPIRTYDEQTKYWFAVKFIIRMVRLRKEI